MENILIIINMISGVADLNNLASVLNDMATITTSTDFLYGRGVGGTILGGMFDNPANWLKMGSLLSGLSSIGIGGVILVLITLSVKKLING